MNAPEKVSDQAITQKLRQAVLTDNSLSTNAKNIKISTLNGVVTLSGPVDSIKEKDAIAKKAKEIQGVTKVDDQLGVSIKK